MAKCPSCKNLLVKKLGKNGEFWLCQSCNKTFNNKMVNQNYKEDFIYEL